MQIISDTGTLAQVRRASADPDQHAEAVAHAAGALAAGREKHEQITETLARHDAAKPETNPAAAAELGAMLVADPAAATKPDWAKRVRALVSPAVNLKRWLWGGSRLRGNRR